MEVRGCTARGDGAHGIRLDADAPASARFHRCLVAGNAEDGLGVSSESVAGIVLVSALAAVGNQGAGLRASLGNKSVIATHSIFAGNAAGGLACETVESSAVSCVAYRQSAPWQGVRRAGCAEVDDPFDGSFELAPEAFAAFTAISDDQLTLDDAAAAIPELPVELADDDVLRDVVAVAGSTATLSPPPQSVRLPALFLRFLPGDQVTEDWRLASSSPLGGTGFSSPGTAAFDPGPFGSPLAGTPGLEKEVLESLHAPLSTTPALTATLGANQALTITFPEPLLLASVVPENVRASSDAGDELGIDLQLMGANLVVTPPPGGWGTAPVRLELHRGLSLSSGVPLATPALLPLNH